MVKKIEKLVKQYKKLLKLHGWNFEVLVSEKEIEDHNAEILYELGKKEATVLVDKQANIKDKKLRNTILHEMLHIFLSNYIGYLENLIHFVHNNPDDVRRINFKRILGKAEMIEEGIIEKLTDLLIERI